MPKIVMPSLYSFALIFFDSKTTATRWTMNARQKNEPASKQASDSNSIEKNIWNEA